MVALKRAVFSDLQCNVESAFDEAGQVMPERLTIKPLPFKVFNIPDGWRPWLWRNLIQVLT